MPGLLGGLLGALMSAIATEKEYNESLYGIFPARASPDLEPNPEFLYLKPGQGRTAAVQAGYQVLAVVLTVTTSFLSGVITGIFMQVICIIYNYDKFIRKNYILAFYLWYNAF